jgi:hypothetical protein
VIVGDDVALGVDDEAGAEGFADLSVVAAIALVGNLAAEEAVEEVLEIILTLALSWTLAAILIGSVVIVAGILGIGLDAAVRIEVSAFESGRLGQGAGVDIDDGRSDGFGDFYERVGFDGGGDDFEGGGIAAVAHAFLSANSMSCEGASDEGGGDGSEDDEGRSEAVGAQACKEGFHSKTS